VVYPALPRRIATSKMAYASHGLGDGRTRAQFGQVLPRPGADLAHTLLEWLTGPAHSKSVQADELSPRDLLWDIALPTFGDVAEAAVKAGFFEQTGAALEALKRTALVIETGARVKSSGRMSGPASAVKLFDQVAKIASGGGEA
jgi:hypothetical protein